MGPRGPVEAGLWAVPSLDLAEKSPACRVLPEHHSKRCHWLDKLSVSDGKPAQHTVLFSWRPFFFGSPTFLMKRKVLWFALAQPSSLLTGQGLSGACGRSGCPGWPERGCRRGVSPASSGHMQPHTVRSLGDRKLPSGPHSPARSLEFCGQTDLVCFQCLDRTTLEVPPSVDKPCYHHT